MDFINIYSNRRTVSVGIIHAVVTQQVEKQTPPDQGNTYDLDCDSIAVALVIQAELADAAPKSGFYQPCSKQFGSTSALLALNCRDFSSV